MTGRDAPLPALRRDVSLVEGAPDETGAPTWVIHDPLQHRYFQIGRTTHAILAAWQPGVDPARMARSASARTGEPIDAAAIAALVDFLREKALTEETAPGQWQHLAAKAERQRLARFRRIAAKALFFRMPLLRPEPLLKAALPVVAPLYSRPAAIVFGLVALLGVFLSLERWDEFVGTFHAFFTLDGMLAFALSLFFMKAVHELGHAFTALRYGCRVPSMGIAFTLLTPILYTDVTDAWRLKSRRQRVAISVAGVVVELALAGVATFLWAFLEDGTARGIAFTLATSGWATTLLVNLNPLMRYDGYYVLSDLLGIDNLQQRAYALGRWKLRQVLIAPGLPPPEYLPPRRQTLLVFYAWASWAYRIVLFSGIALILDRFAFRAAGSALLLIGGWFLVAKPVLAELAEWPRIGRPLVSRTRVGALVTVILAALVVVVVPWSTRVEIPAVLIAADLTQVYAAEPARIVSVGAERYASVHQGDLLLTLDRPDLDSAIAKTRAERDLVGKRLAQMTANRDDLSESLVLRKQWASLTTELDGLGRQRHELELRAPIDGTVLQTALNLHAGRWVNGNEVLLLLSAGRRMVVRGYVHGTDVARLVPASIGRFIPDDLTFPAFEVQLDSVSRVTARRIDIAELTSLSGGRIAVRPESETELVPVASQYPVDFQPLGLLRLPAQVVRGVVAVDGSAESLALGIWRQVAKVVLLESGL